MDETISEVHFPSIQADQRSLYAPLLGKIDLFQHDLLKEGAVLTFVAKKNDIPVGLIAAYVFDVAKEAHIVTLNVMPSERRQGIGTALLQALLNKLKHLDIHIIEIRYKEDISSFLAKTGFRPPEILYRRYYFNARSFHPDWFFSPKPLLPKEYTLFYWKDLKNEEKNELMRLINQNPSLSQVDPLKPSFDEASSVGLRKNQQVIGWMITRHLEPKVLEYSAFYIFSEERGLGPAVNLLKSAIRSHLISEIDTVGKVEINFKVAPSKWLRFIEKRLAPFAFEIENTWISHRLEI